MTDLEKELYKQIVELTSKYGYLSGLCSALPSALPFAVKTEETSTLSEKGLMAISIDDFHNLQRIVELIEENAQ